MKRLTLNILFLLLCWTTTAQEIDYFANNPKWRMDSSCAIGGGWPSYCDYVYYINGDSIVNTVMYKKLYHYGKCVRADYDSGPNPIIDIDIFDHFRGLLRQEQNKIFINDGSEEELLYDFDLSVGDTLPITYNNFHEGIVVESIDSLLVGNEYRKVFNTSGEEQMLIEGIGHIGGFIEFLPPMLECGYNFECFTLNDTTYYPDYGLPCDLDIDIPEYSQMNAIRIYPNPVGNQFTVELDPSIKDIVTICIYDINGKEVVRQKLDGNHHRINTEYLDSGIYSYMIFNTKGILKQSRIVKD